MESTVPHWKRKSNHHNITLLKALKYLIFFLFFYADNTIMYIFRCTHIHIPVVLPDDLLLLCHLSVPLASSTSLAISVAPVTQCVIHRHFVLSPANCVYMVSDNLYSTRHCQHTACDYLCHLVRVIVKRLGLDKNLIVLYRHRYQHWQLTKQFIWILWFSFTSLCNRLILIMGPCLKIQTYAFQAI